MRLLVLGLLLLAMPTAMRATPLTLGSLSNTPYEEISIFLPFAKYLAAGLGELGIDDARVKVSRNHTEMAELLKRGEVDLFIDSSMSALIVQRLSGGAFLARRWKKGLSEYHSVVFVRSESTVRELADLAERTIAFEEPFSSSGYLLPASEIHQVGLTLIPTGKNKLALTVGYRFSNADENTLLWVLHGRTDAGAMAANKFSELATSMAEELRVIHRSNTIPYHVVVSRPGLSDALRRAIHGRLLGMEQNETGRQTLKAFEQTVRFDDIPDDALPDLRLIKLNSSVEKK